MEEENGDKKKPKTKSKLSALKSRLQIPGHHKTILRPNVSPPNQLPMQYSNSSTERDFTEMRFQNKDGILADISIDGKWRKKNSLDIEGNLGGTF